MKCLCCGKTLSTSNEFGWHKACIKRFFGTAVLPKIEIDNKMWEVAAVNADSGDGIIEVNLKEEYSNSIEKAALKEKEEQEKEES